VPPKHRRRRRLTSLLLIGAVVLGAGVYVLARAHVPAIFGETGCTARTGHSAVALDPQQAQIAATIAGVALSRRMPPRAVTVAYAAAMQESHLHNLDYGDRDSVGVFQQRPSQGWGPARKLIDPVYASTKFFKALAQVRGYQRLPVYQAAQAVQRPSPARRRALSGAGPRERPHGRGKSPRPARRSCRPSGSCPRTAPPGRGMLRPCWSGRRTRPLAGP
jgi:hypothetical protein